MAGEWLIICGHDTNHLKKTGMILQVGDGY